MIAFKKDMTNFTLIEVNDRTFEYIFF